MGSGIVSPDDLDQDNGTKLLNYCIVIGSGKETLPTTQSSAPYLETSILLVLLSWLVGEGMASLKQGLMWWLV
ncbi:hypothetical protein TNCV_1836271 [Trichonephila clavipes]|nr:hypothetical protein TNCV_1836271 [Trichonephila clavipes]